MINVPAYALLTSISQSDMSMNVHTMIAVFPVTISFDNFSRQLSVIAQDGKPLHDHVQEYGRVYPNVSFTLIRKQVPLPKDVLLS